MKNWPELRNFPFSLDPREKAELYIGRVMQVELVVGNKTGRLYTDNQGMVVRTRDFVFVPGRDSIYAPLFVVIKSPTPANREFKDDDGNWLYDMYVGLQSIDDAEFSTTILDYVTFDVASSIRNEIFQYARSSSFVKGVDLMNYCVSLGFDTNFDRL